MGLFFMVGVMHGQAQVTDSLAVDADPAALSTPTQAAQDTLPAGQTRQAQSGTLQEGEVQFQAKDSLVFDFRQDRVAKLYGSSTVNHNAGKLESGKVTLNLDENIVRANTQTPQDTLSQPVLIRENQPPVRSNKIAFNYQTEKGRFDVARVEIDRGKITGTKVKNASRHVVYLEDAIYSTCTLDHPHYYIKADRAKVVRRGGKKEVFFQNARLYILDIPYPIVFPFGYFPGNVDKQQSGILTPTYIFQNTGSRGLGLRNVGWFQYFNDYMVGQASGDIYTSGTFFLDASTTYRKRNAFGGSVQIGYSRERGLEPTDPNFNTRTEKNLSIRHNQQFSPYSDISVNVNLRTQDFFQRNSFDIDERVQSTTNSSINYSYRHPGDIYTFSSSIQQSLNFQSNVTTVTGPAFSFNLRSFNPFEAENTSQQSTKWYQNLSLQYDNSFQSDYRFDPIRGDSARINWFEALLDPGKYREATGNNNHYNYGFRQNAGATINNLLPSQYLNLSANVDYTEFWFPGSTEFSFNPDSNRVEERQVRGFASTREFSTSLNFSTTFYGFSNAKIGNIEGFRHTIRPNISLSYSPDFSSDLFGNFQEVQVDTDGRTEQRSIFRNEVFNGPRGGEQRSINFGISNVFEAKQVKRDSTGEKTENILRIIDQLSLNSSYNFAADSLKLSSLRTSLRSNIVDGLSFRASANFNFYERDDRGRLVDRFLLAESNRLAELTNFTIDASSSFSGGEGNGVQVNNDPYFPRRYDPLNQSIFNAMDPNFNRRPVQSLKSPWSFSVNFSYNWNLVPNGDNRKSATLNARNIRFQLTPKWSFSTRLGYDFIQRELTPSQFNLNRKLHNWTLSFQMNPFGDFQYYFFRLSINSSQIQSIFQKLPLLKNLERSSSPSGRGINNFR